MKSDLAVSIENRSRAQHLGYSSWVALMDIDGANKLPSTDGKRFLQTNYRYATFERLTKEHAGLGRLMLSLERAIYLGIRIPFLGHLHRSLYKILFSIFISIFVPPQIECLFFFSYPLFSFLFNIQKNSSKIYIFIRHVTATSAVSKYCRFRNPEKIGWSFNDTFILGPITFILTTFLTHNLYCWTSSRMKVMGPLNPSLLRVSGNSYQARDWNVTLSIAAYWTRSIHIYTTSRKEFINSTKERIFALRDREPTNFTVIHLTEYTKSDVYTEFIWRSGGWDSLEMSRKCG
jgi:hypothetical protein